VECNTKTYKSQALFVGFFGVTLLVIVLAGEAGLGAFSSLLILSSSSLKTRLMSTNAISKSLPVTIYPLVLLCAF